MNFLCKECGRYQVPPFGACPHCGTIMLVTRDEAAVAKSTACLKCGDCCRANGLIPPFLGAELEAGSDVPACVQAMILNMRRQADLCNEAQYCICLFLNEDNTCAIHGQAWRPEMCLTFEPGSECPGQRGAM